MIKANEDSFFVPSAVPSAKATTKQLSAQGSENHKQQIAALKERLNKASWEQEEAKEEDNTY